MANSVEKYNFSLPVGRLISGSVSELRKQDHKGQSLEEKDYNWYIGLAVEKTNPQVTPIINNLFGLAQRGYSRDAGAMALINLGFGPFGPGQKGFSWKIKDGDAIDPATGQLENEHAKGCWVFHLSNRFPIKVGNAQNIEIDPKTVQRGYFVDASVSASINEQTGDRAGIYLNLQAVRLIAYGEIIVGGMSLGQMFGDAPAQYAQLPAGASQMPTAAPNMGAPMQTGQPQAMPLPGAPAPQGMPLPGAPAPQMMQPAPQGMPMQQPQQMMQPAPQMQQPQAMPLPGAPAPQMQQPQQAFTGQPAPYLQPGNVHAAAMPLPGAPVAQQQPNMQSPTGYPTNVQPHTQFLQGPQG